MRHLLKSAEASFSECARDAQRFAFWRDLLSGGMAAISLIEISVYFYRLEYWNAFWAIFGAFAFSTLIWKPINSLVLLKREYKLIYARHRIDIKAMLADYLEYRKKGFR